MFHDFNEGFQRLIGAGLQPKDLGVFQVGLRGIIVFITALIMVRLADRRFFARKTAFDVVLGFILASMLARAVNGSAAFFPSLVTGFILIGFHRLLGFLAFHSHRVGLLVKGTDDRLIENGKMNHTAMRKTNISEADLLEDLRTNGRVEDPSQVKIARLERSGDISVIPKKD